MNLAYANGFLLVLVLIELVLIRAVKKEDIPWKEVVFNLNSGHIILWISRGLQIAGFHFVLTQSSIKLFDDWNYLSQFIFTFMAWDLCFYWSHRFNHSFKILWAVHAVHHEGEHFNLSLGIRNSWYSTLVSFPFFAVLALIGVPLEVFIACSGIHYFIQFYNHNSFVKKSGILEYIMITPSHHRVHHGMNEEYVDKNFGGTFVFWDKLFGTFQKEEDENPVVYGVKGYQKNFDVVWANNFHFLALLKKTVPKFPSPKKNLLISDFNIALSGFALFLLLVYYIYLESNLNQPQTIGFFSIIFLGVFATGGLSENRIWGLVLWILNFCIVLPYYIWKFDFEKTLFSIVLAIFFLLTLSILRDVNRTFRKT